MQFYMYVHVHSESDICLLALQTSPVLCTVGGLQPRYLIHIKKYLRLQYYLQCHIDTFGITCGAHYHLILQSLQ